MTSDELKGTVSTILRQQHSAQLYLVLKVNDELVLRLADIEDESTAPEIQHMFEEFLETTIVANEDMIVRNNTVSDSSCTRGKNNSYKSHNRAQNVKIIMIYC